jgi:hypothetical protein
LTQAFLLLLRGFSSLWFNIIHIQDNTTIEAQLGHFGFLHNFVGELAFSLLRSIRNSALLLAFLGRVEKDRGILQS